MKIGRPEEGRGCETDVLRRKYFIIEKIFRSVSCRPQIRRIEGFGNQLQCVVKVMLRLRLRWNRKKGVLTSQMQKRTVKMQSGKVLKKCLLY